MRRSLDPNREEEEEDDVWLCRLSCRPRSFACGGSRVMCELVVPEIASLISCERG